jgi:hypothetical protein
MAIARDDSNLVEPQDACPRCGQRDQDTLEWIDDRRVQCLACWTVYTPSGGTIHD